MSSIFLTGVGVRSLTNDASSCPKFLKVFWIIFYLRTKQNGIVESLLDALTDFLKSKQNEVFLQIY